MTDHAPSSGIWKGPDSPAGHEFYAPKSFADLPDCPVCKYGTPYKRSNGTLVCIDCGATVRITDKKTPP